MLAPALAVLLRVFFEPISLSAQTDAELPAHASLELDAGDLGERCVSKAELEQSVQAQLGRVVFVEAGTPAKLLVRVRLEERAPGQFHASVASEPVPATPDAPASTRDLEATGDCRALDEQLALVVALLVDADPVPPSPPPEPDPAPEPPPEPPPSPPVQDTSPVSSAPSWESRPAGPWHLALGVAGVAGFRLLPHVGGGASVEVLVTPPAWPGLRLRTVGFFPDHARAAPGASLGVTLVLAGLGVCPELGVAGPVTFTACLGADATLLRIESLGLDAGRTVNRFGSHATGGLLVSVALGAHFRAGLELGTAFPFHTERFTVDREGRREQLYRTPFAPALLGVGFAYEFY